MDKVLLTAELAELELIRQQIADLAARIDRQRALLCELQDAERASEKEAARLEAMEDSMEGFEHHARLIELELSRARTQAAGDRQPADPA